jgi:hypothetical protein
MEIVNFNDSLLDEQTQIYNIYFNNQFNNLLIIVQPDDFIFHNSKILNLFPELNLLLSLEIENEKLETIKELNNDIFVNYEDAKVRVNRILNDKVIDSKLSIDEIKNLIKKYFSINTNPQDCIKFTNIWNTISSEIKVSDSYVNYIKRQLPNILTDLGLQKKRLADGIYWYGLVVKNLDDVKPVSKQFNYSKITDKPVTDDDFNKFMEQRKLGDYLVNSPIKSIIKEDGLETNNLQNIILEALNSVSDVKLNDIDTDKVPEVDPYIGSVQSNQITNDGSNNPEEKKNKKQPVKKGPAKKQTKNQNQKISQIESNSNVSEKIETVPKNKKIKQVDEVQPPSPEISKVIKKKQTKKSSNK